MATDTPGLSQAVDDVTGRKTRSDQPETNIRRSAVTSRHVVCELVVDERGVVM
jgi:hypothetical protein